MFERSYLTLGVACPRASSAAACSRPPASPLTAHLVHVVPLRPRRRLPFAPQPSRVSVLPVYAHARGRASTRCRSVCAKPGRTRALAVVCVQRWSRWFRRERTLLRAQRPFHCPRRADAACVGGRERRTVGSSHQENRGSMWRTGGTCGGPQWRRWARYPCRPRNSRTFPPLLRTLSPLYSTPESHIAQNGG